MLDISNSKNLSIMLPNSNKVLAQVLKSATKEQLEIISQGKDLKSILNSLMLDSSKTQSSNKIILQLLQNNPTLKDLLNVNATIKELLSSLKGDKSTLPLQKILTDLITDIKKIDHSSLKEKLSNSGVFLESKLKDVKNIKDIMSNDLKAVLLLTSKESIVSSNAPQIYNLVEKLTLQIDYYQLLSHLSNSSSIYLPFAWDDLQEGNITIKKAKKDRFYCDIELKLKEYGELKINLVLYEKNQLNIKITSQNKTLHELLKQNIPNLRESLIKMQITPRELRLVESSNTKSSKPYDTSLDDINLGFEVMV